MVAVGNPSLAEDDSRESGSLRTLERGLNVLELLATSETGMSFSEVRDRIGLSTGTINRLLQTLVKRGYVEHDARARTYQIGLHVIELQGSALVSNRMATEARPRLLDLMQATGCRVHLAVRRGDSVVYIDRVDNQESLSRFSPVARGGPLHATSLGKSMLAFSDDQTFDEYLRKSRRERLTEHTLVSESEIRAETARIRARGYATEFEESHIGVYCVGAPIFDYTGVVVAAVSVAGGHDEIVPHVDAIASSVVGVAGSISSSFGYRQR